MKNLLNFIANVLLVLVWTTFIMKAASMFIPVSLDLTPTTADWARPWLISGVAFFVLLMIIGFAQGVAENSIKAAGAFIIGQTFAVLTAELIIGLGYVRLNTNTSQMAFYIFTALFSAFFAGFTYYTITERPIHGGELMKMLILKTKQLAWTVSGVFIVLVVGYALIVFTGDINSPATIPTGYIIKGDGWSGIVAFFASRPGLYFCLIIVIPITIGYLRDVGDVMVKLLITTFLAVAAVIVVSLFEIVVIKASGNIVTILGNTTQASAGAALAVICFIELFTVFAFEARHPH